MASQMTHATIDSVAVDMSCGEGNLFRANGSSIKFNGMLKVYQVVKDEDDVSGEENKNLPKLSEKDKLNLIKSEKKTTFYPPSS